MKLAETAKALRVERVLALTATATPAVVEDICSGFGIPRECAFVTGFYRSNLNLFVSPVRAEERDALLLERLRTRAPGPAIVYVTLQRTAEDVALRLANVGLPTKAYHAGLDAEVRTMVQDWFMAAPDGIVVAAERMAAGQKFDLPAAMAALPIPPVSAPMCRVRARLSPVSLPLSISLRPKYWTVRIQ